MTLCFPMLCLHYTRISYMLSAHLQHSFVLLTAPAHHTRSPPHTLTAPHMLTAPHTLTAPHRSFVLLSAHLYRTHNTPTWRSFVYACSLCRSPFTTHRSPLTAHLSPLITHRSPAPLFAHSLFAVYAILCPLRQPSLLPHHRTQPVSSLLRTHHRNQSLSPHQGVLMRVALLPLSVNRITLCPSSAPANVLQIYTKVLLRCFMVSPSPLTSCLQRSC